MSYGRYCCILLNITVVTLEVNVGILDVYPGVKAPPRIRSCSIYITKSPCCEAIKKMIYWYILISGVNFIPFGYRHHGMKIPVENLAQEREFWCKVRKYIFWIFDSVLLFWLVYKFWSIRLNYCFNTIFWGGEDTP